MKYEYYLQEPNFRVENIDIQSVSRLKGYRHSFKSGRMKHGFIYTVSGMMCDTFHGTENKMYASAGELVFIPKGCVYTGIYAEANTEIRIVQFDVLSGTLPDYLTSPIKIELPEAGKLIESFFNPVENHTVNHPFYYLSCLYNLLWQIDRQCYGVPAKYMKIRAALSEIAECWDKNATVGYYASLCDMSEGNFRRLFREYTGMSPIEYRNDLRLNNAKGKLQSGEYNVSEAAELCGFTNLSFFTRLYKKKFGHTPKNE